MTIWKLIAKLEQEGTLWYLFSNFLTSQRAYIVAYRALALPDDFGSTIYQPPVHSASTVQATPSVTSVPNATSAILTHLQKSSHDHLQTVIKSLNSSHRADRQTFRNQQRNNQVTDKIASATEKLATALTD